MLAPRLRGLLSALLVSTVAAAEPAPCAPEARFSPCFDADPLWLSPSPSLFASVPSARSLEPGELSALLGAGYEHGAVSLLVPSPHRYGREVPVVENTSTLTLGVRYGVGYGLELGLALPLVPYQNGTGVEGVTSQQGDGLSTVAVRDPRVDFAAVLLGRGPGAPFVLGAHLTLAIPLGTERALAGYAGPTLAPGLVCELALGRFTLGADASFRFRQAVDFANTSQGSEATLAAGAAYDFVRTNTRFGVGLEAWLRPKLTGAPPGSAEDSRDLPAEWLGSVHFEPRTEGPWSFLAGAGSGLPLSYAAEPGTAREATLGVTAPDFRAVLATRHVFR